MTTTWLRIVLYTGAGSDSAAYARLEDFVQDGMRLLDGRPGYRGGGWGRDAGTGTFAAVTNWATRSAIEALSGELAMLHDVRREQGLAVAAVANLRLVTAPLPWSAQQWADVTSRRSSNWLRVALHTPADGRRPDDYLADSAGETAFLLRGLRGFRVGYWGVDPVDGTAAALTYWSSREAIEAARPQVERVHAERAAHGLASGWVVNLEVLNARAPASSGAVGRI